MITNKRLCRHTLNSLLLPLVLSTTSGLMLNAMRPTITWAQAMPDREASQLYSQGVALYRTQQWQQSLIKFQSALELYQQLGNCLSMASTLNNIGLVYASLDNYSAALRHYEESLAIKRELGNREGKARTLANMGNVLMVQTNPDQAIIYLRRAVDIYEAVRADNQTLEPDLQVSFDTSVQDTYNVLATLLQQQGLTSEAQQVLDLLEN